MSHSAMDKTTVEQIIALQERILYQEDALQKLDDVITRQYQLIDTLTRRVKDVEDKMEMLEEAMKGTDLNLSPIDEKPPHY